MKIDEIIKTHKLLKCFKEEFKWTETTFEEMQEKQELSDDALEAYTCFMLDRINEKDELDRAVWFSFSGYRLEKL